MHVIWGYPLMAQVRLIRMALARRVMSSSLEDAFEAWLAHSGPRPMPKHVKRVPIRHPTRRWRFDFAWPDPMVAVEIEGGLYQSGRHQSFKGFYG